MKKKLILFAILAILIFSTGIIPAFAQELPTVNVLLFFDPNCPHCDMVKNEVLPPLVEQYGSQLNIQSVDISTESGYYLFRAIVTELALTDRPLGVPLMLVGEHVLIGSQQIPDELPGIIEAGLAAGGVEWPTGSPTLTQALTDNGLIDPTTGAAATQADVADQTDAAASDEITPTEAEAVSPETSAEDNTPTEEAEPAPTEIEAEAASASPTEAAVAVVDSGESSSPFASGFQDPDGPNFAQFGERFQQDPVANTIAVVVLASMIALVVWIGIQFMQASTPKVWPDFILPILLVIGLGIAIYLATVEVSGNEAICGPVGDCNAVQSSKYAKVFGIPVAILGILGYVSIGSSWLVAKFGKGAMQFYAKIAMFLFALGGLLFFIYLTFLEPFVIGATCAWCITSAIIFSLINIYTTAVVLNAWAEIDLELDDDEDFDSSKE